MPTKNNAQKRYRQSEVRRMRNRMAKSSVRTENKKFLEALKANDVELAEKEFRSFMKLIDTAGRKGCTIKYPPEKSRLQKQLNSLKKAAASRG